MRGFPQELVIALIFGAILLAQFLYRELRRKAASMQVEPEVVIQPVSAAPAPAPTPAPTPADAAPRPGKPRMAALPVLVRASRLTPRRARRFSRTALMPDRRAVQDAIVLAAILQPCHANRARDIEGRTIL